jgi:hypothetical protein
MGLSTMGRRLAEVAGVRFAALPANTYMADSPPKYHQKAKPAETDISIAFRNDGYPPFPVLLSLFWHPEIFLP